MHRPPLADQPVQPRHRLSALWAALMFCYVYGDYFGLYVPGKLAGMIAGSGPIGPVSQASLSITAALLALPGLMVALSLLLPATLCRWASIVLGLFYAVVVGLTMPGAWQFYLMLSTLEILLSLGIVATAWRWPRAGTAPVA